MPIIMNSNNCCHCPVYGLNNDLCMCVRVAFLVSVSTVRKPI